MACVACIKSKITDINPLIVTVLDLQKARALDYGSKLIIQYLIEKEYNEIINNMNEKCAECPNE